MMLEKCIKSLRNKNKAIAPQANEICEAIGVQLFIRLLKKQQMSK